MVLVDICRSRGARNKDWWEEGSACSQLPMTLDHTPEPRAAICNALNTHHIPSHLGLTIPESGREGVMVPFYS